MLTIQQLRDKRNDLAKDARNLVENKGEAKWTAEDQAKIDALYADIDDCESKIKALERALNIENAGAVVVPPGAHIVDSATAEQARQRQLAKNVFRAWANGGVEAAQRLVAEKPEAYAAFAPGIQAAATSPGSAGGFTIPTILVPELLTRLKDYGGMREWADVMSMSSGETLAWPTMDETAEEGELLAENATAADSDVVFGTVGIGAYKYSSKAVPVSIELLQDSAVDVDGIVLSALATRIARIQNKHFTIGTGTGQPMGAITAAAVGKLGATGQTVSVTYDDLVDLEHSIDPAYRKLGCAFQFHDLTLRTLRKLKDSGGRPIWLPQAQGSMKDGAPATLLNYPYIINQDVAQMAANAKSILFGHGRKYKIRDVMAVTMYRFTDSAYMKKGQVGFLAFARSDGRCVDATGGTAASAQAFKVSQNSAT
jgi:HK97 family phage major capsid protein